MCAGNRSLAETGGQNVAEAENTQTTIDTRGRTLMVVLLVIVAVFNNTDRGIFSLAMPAIKADYAFTDSQLGLLGGLSFGLCYGIAALPIGWLALRTSRSALLVACLAVWSCATGLTSIAGGFAGLFAARSVVGMGEAGGMPLSLSLTAARYAPHERAAATGWITAGQAFGSIAGAFLTGWLIAWAGWRSAFLVLGLPGLLLALVMGLTLREPATARGEPARLADVLRLWRAPMMRALTLGFVLTGIVTYGTQAWLPSFLARRFHLGPGDVGMLTGLIAGGSALVGAIVTGQMVHRYGPGRPGYAMALCGVISLIGIPAGVIGSYTENLMLAVVMTFIVAFGNGARALLFYTEVQNCSDDATRPMAIAINASAVVLVGSGLGPTVMGLISDKAPGGIATAMAAGSSLLPILIVGCCWRLYRMARA